MEVQFIALLKTKEKEVVLLKAFWSNPSEKNCHRKFLNFSQIPAIYFSICFFLRLLQN